MDSGREDVSEIAIILSILRMVNFHQKNMQKNSMHPTKPRLLLCGGNGTDLTESTFCVTDDNG
jgi:hypothetical protein